MADLLDGTPTATVGGESAQENLTLAFAVKVAPCQIDGVVFARCESRVKNFRCAVGMDQPARRESLAVVIGHTVIDAGFLFRTSHSEPSHVGFAPLVRSVSGPGG